MQQLLDASILMLHLMRVVVFFDLRLCTEGYFAISIESLWDGVTRKGGDGLMTPRGGTGYAPLNTLR